MTTILGIDPSTKTGIAVLIYDEKGKLVYKRSMEIEFKKLKGIERVCAFSDAMIDLLDDVEPNHILIENYGFGNAHTLATLVEIGTAIRMAIHLSEYSYEVVSPNGLKKFVTGKGNVKKDQMALHLYKVFGLEGETDNEVDALGLALLAAYGTGVVDTEGLSIARKEAIATVYKK